MYDSQLPDGLLSFYSSKDKQKNCPGKFYCIYGVIKVIYFFEMIIRLYNF